MEEEETKRKKGDVVNFNTYGNNNKVVKGIIKEVLFNNEIGEFYMIKPNIKFENFDLVTRTNNEIKALN